jgi:hypothetical protein
LTAFVGSSPIYLYGRQIAPRRAGFGGWQREAGCVSGFATRVTKDCFI